MNWSLFGEILFLGVAAGTLGSMVGIGGGVLLIPLLSSWLGVPIHQAIGASLIAVIATSASASSSYLRARLTNVQLAMTLQLPTALGAILGGSIAAVLSRKVLSSIFIGLLVFVGISMLRRVAGQADSLAVESPAGNMILGERYWDPYLQRDVEYRVQRLPFGLGVSLAAGTVSGLLGIGGGVIQVPAMVLLMGVPMRAAAATSNLMIGITALASGYIYYSHGFVNPLVAVPTAMGVFLGSLAGARLSQRVRGGLLQIILAIVLFFLALQMALAILV